MAKRKQQDIKPFFEIKHDYEDSLKAYLSAASMLYQTVRTVLDLKDSDLDEAALKKLIGTLKEPVNEFEKAAFSHLRS